MKDLLGSQNLWEFVENSYVESESPAVETNFSTEDWAEGRLEKGTKRALFLIYQSIEKSPFEKIFNVQSSKRAREILQKSYQDAKKVKKIRPQACERNFKN